MAWAPTLTVEKQKAWEPILSVQPAIKSPLGISSSLPTMRTSTPAVAGKSPSLFADTIKGIPAAAGSLLKSVATQTGKGLGLVGKAIDYPFGLPGRVTTGFNPAVPTGFSEQVQQATQAVTGSKTAGVVAGFGAGLAEPLGGFGKAVQGAKTVFTSTIIRALNEQEATFLPDVVKVIRGSIDKATIAHIPGSLAKDGVTRPLEISKDILTKKIIPKHGAPSPENLIINGNDWDAALKNMRVFGQDGKLLPSNPDKINLLKKVPGTDNVLVIAANRADGHFVVSHYEIYPGSGNEIQSLLGRGDFVTRSGTALGPEGFLSAPSTQGGVEGLLGRAGAPSKVANAPKIVNSAERGFITSTRQLAPELAPKLKGDYVPRSTDKLAIAAKNEIAANPSGAERLARTGTDDKAVATASEYIKKLTADAIRATDKVAQNALYDKAAAIANDAARNLTEAGRQVQAASILGKLTPEGQVRFAAREIQKYNAGVGIAKKVPELTAEQTKHIHEEATKVFNMPDGEAKAIAYQKLQDEIHKLVPTPLMGKITAVWKAGLLTGLKTSGLNIASNISHGVSEVLKDIPAAVVDRITSILTGRRTLALTTKGTVSGTAEGFTRGWRYFRTGYDLRDIGAKLDFKKINFGTSKFAKAIQTYEETIFHMLGAEDQPFYYGAKARSLASQAIAQAKNEGISLSERGAFVQKLIQNPTDDMLKYATIDAETAVFQNKTGLGTAAKAVQNIPGVGQFIAPFTRTPAAVATQMINYSPIGIVKTIIENIGKGKFDQRLFSQGIGRGITGTAIGYLGMKLYEKGMVSLGYPTTEKEQKQWQLEGRSANSIKVGGQWRSANVLGPAGLDLIAAGYVQKALKETGSVWQAITVAAAGLGKTVTDQTFLKGVQGLVQAISDPVQSATSYFSGLLSSIVPTIIGDVARGTDITERSAGGVTGKLQAKIPGARENLQPQVNVFGQDVPTQDFLTVMLDPTRPATATNDDATKELKRLWDAGFKVTPTQLGNKSGYAGLTPDQNTELWQQTGTLIHEKMLKLFALPEYQKMDDEEKGNTITKLVGHFNTLSRAQMIQTLTTDLHGDELKARLSELKTGGLLTQTVFKEYLQLRANASQ